MILSHGFIHNNVDKCIYSKSTENFGVIICLYFDDLLIFGTNMQGVEVDTILSIKVNKHSRGHSLCQSHYIENLLLQFNHLKFKEVNTTYDSSIKLKENYGRTIAQLEYASAIGSLMYAMHLYKAKYCICNM